MIPELRGVTPERLLQIIASSSTTPLTQSDYVYLTVALNRAAKSGSRPSSTEWESIVGRWLRVHASKMPVRQATLTMNTLARTGASDSCGWIRGSLKALVEHSAELVPQDLSLAVNAVAKVLADENKRSKDGVPECVLALCEELICSVLPRVGNDLSPQGIANILHACAKLKIRPWTLQIVEEFCVNSLLSTENVAGVLVKMNPHEQSLIIYSLSRLYPSGNPIVEKVFEFVTPMLTSNESLRSMQAKDLVMLLNSFEKANFVPESDIVKRLSYFISPAVDKMTIAELACVGKFFVSCGINDHSILMECSKRLHRIPRSQLRSPQNLSLLMGIYAKALLRDVPLLCGVLLGAFMSCEKPDPASLARTLLAISRLDLVNTIEGHHRRQLLQLAKSNLPKSDQHSLVCLAYALCTPGWAMDDNALLLDALQLAAKSRIIEKPTFGPQLAVAMQVARVTKELTLSRLRSLSWLWNASTEICRSGEGLDALRLSAVQEDVSVTVRHLMGNDCSTTLEREAKVNDIWGCDLLLKTSSHG